MALLLLLPIVAIAAVVALATGVPGRRVAVVVGAVVGGLVVLTALELVLVLGLGVGGDDDDAGDDATSPPGTTATTEAADRSDDERPPALLPPAGVRPVDAVLVVPEDTGPFPAPEEPLGGLRDGDLLLLEATLGRDAELRQCAAGAPSRAECGEGVPVPAPIDGTAQFLAPVAETLRTPAGTADCTAETCVLVLFGAGEDEVIARLPLVFGDEVPTPTVALRRDGPFDDADIVQVRLAGFEPGEEVVVTQCTPPGPTDRSVCGAPAPEVAVQIGPDGAADVVYAIRLGPVGEAAHECRRAEPCAIGVLGSAVAAPTAEISLAGSPGSDVPSSQVAWGLAAAALLGAAAIFLLVRGDWHEPEGDPFFGMKLTVPEGWEHLRDDFDEPDSDSEATSAVTE